MHTLQIVLNPSKGISPPSKAMHEIKDSLEPIQLWYLDQDWEYNKFLRTYILLWRNHFFLCRNSSSLRNSGGPQEWRFVFLRDCEWWLTHTHIHAHIHTQQKQTKQNKKENHEYPVSNTRIYSVKHWCSFVDWNLFVLRKELCSSFCEYCSTMNYPTFSPSEI